MSQITAVPVSAPQLEDPHTPVPVVKIEIQLTPAMDLGLRRIEDAIAKARTDLGDDVIPPGEDETEIYLRYFFLIRIGYEETEALGMTFETIEHCERVCLFAWRTQAFLEEVQTIIAAAKERKRVEDERKAAGDEAQSD